MGKRRKEHSAPNAYSLAVRRWYRALDLGGRLFDHPFQLVIRSDGLEG
jgi:hypothetical protein